ncbi:MAG: hypothetical protein MMC23_005695 [Stictis urceolatum]|nr:hypothetical protein [Stictis urceolata]
MQDKVQVLVTYGPYGKDIVYHEILAIASFHAKSYSEVNPEHKSQHSAWETPDPGFWRGHGYAVVRADERGLGQSPGVLDTMSRGTSECFYQVVEWCAERQWSSGKVGLLGISYYAGSQWRVAAKNPKGLSAIVPWEDTIEGDLSEEERQKSCNDQNVDNENNQFRDDIYYASKEYDMGDIKVPLLSVANWGGILLHLRGNVEGWVHAGSDLKYLRFITEVQRSFLDAFLKDDDRYGWATKGKVPPVDLVLRKGDVGFNDAEKEKAYLRRQENEWPIARTQWTKYYLQADQTMQQVQSEGAAKLAYRALGTLESQSLIHFKTPPFEQETEITGNIVARLNVSINPEPSGPNPSDIGLFLTLRHISPEGKEVFYTGTAGDPVPLTKGWLRVSMRKVNNEHHKQRDYLPWRDYYSTDRLPVIPGEVYSVDVEVWPTNVVVEKGGRLVFEVSSGDTQGSGIFGHNNSVDRSEAKFVGMNYIYLGKKFVNYVILPTIPPK